MASYLIHPHNHGFSPNGRQALANRAEILRNLAQLPKQNIREALMPLMASLLIIGMFMTLMTISMVYLIYESIVSLREDFDFGVIAIGATACLIGIFAARISQYTFYYAYHVLRYSTLFPTYLGLARFGNVRTGNVINITPATQRGEASAIYYRFTSPDDTAIESKFLTWSPKLPHIGDVVQVLYLSDEIHVIL